VFAARAPVKTITHGSIISLVTAKSTGTDGTVFAWFAVLVWRSFRTRRSNLDERRSVVALPRLLRRRTPRNDKGDECHLFCAFISATPNMNYLSFHPHPNPIKGEGTSRPLSIRGEGWGEEGGMPLTDGGLCRSGFARTGRADARVN
jgi:hypothetical protein